MNGTPNWPLGSTLPIISQLDIFSQSKWLQDRLRCHKLQWHWHFLCCYVTFTWLLLGSVGLCWDLLALYLQYHKPRNSPRYPQTSDSANTDFWGCLPHARQHAWSPQLCEFLLLPAPWPRAFRTLHPLRDPSAPEPCVLTAVSTLPAHLCAFQARNSWVTISAMHLEWRLVLLCRLWVSPRSPPSLFFPPSGLLSVTVQVCLGLLHCLLALSPHEPVCWWPVVVVKSHPSWCSPCVSSIQPHSSRLTFSVTVLWTWGCIKFASTSSFTHWSRGRK